MIQRTALSISLACLALSSCSATDADRAPAAAYVVAPGDRAGVIAALEDYIDGFTLGRPDLLERSLSPGLVKKGYRRAGPGSPFGAAIPLSYDAALELAASRAIAPDDPALLESSVEVFEVADKTAAAKVTAFWGIDYVHLVKEDGRWTIHHVVWQTEPERADG